MTEATESESESGSGHTTADSMSPKTTETTESGTDTVEIGELTLQYTAHGPAAKEEIKQFREELRASVSELESASAVVEMHSLPEFDSRLSWGDSR